MLNYKNAENNEVELITHLNPKSPVAEAYRILRTNISFSGLDQPYRTLMVTSAGHSDGKSTTLSNLGVAMAQAGSRVLIIDCDLRKPMQHKIFGLPNRQGVSNLFVEEFDLETVVQATPVAGLEVLTSGPIPPNPSELLGSQKMQRLLEKVRGNYDLTLIDVPPVVAVADAAILSSQVDGVILVVKAGNTRIDMIKQGKELLENGNARVIGVVLNGMPISKDDYAYYYNYGESDERPRKVGLAGKRFPWKR